MGLSGIVWVPLFVISLATIIDLTLVLHQRSALAHMVHQINRAVATGRLSTAQEAQALLDDRLQRYGPRAYGLVTVGRDSVETQVSIPADEVSSMGSVAMLTDITIALRYSHLLER